MSSQGQPPRVHFYAAVSTLEAKQPLAHRTAGTLATHPARLLGTSGPAPAAAQGRLAIGAIDMPQEELGLSVHPAVGEAALHISLVPYWGDSRHHVLRVAAKVETVQLVQPARAASLWTISSSSSSSSAASRGWQQMRGPCGGTVASLCGMETRRLMLQRPAVMTPRTPLSPYTPFTPHSPHTPIYLHSPSANSYLAQPFGGFAAAGHISHALLAVAEEGAPQAMNHDSLQLLVAEAVQTVLGSAIGSDQPLMAAGLDSLGATELQQNLVSPHACTCLALGGASGGPKS